MSSRPVVLISAAQLALAQLTNFALFDEKGNAFGDIKSLNRQSGKHDNRNIMFGVVRWT